MGIICGVLANLKTINLCDYGINVWAILQLGPGTHNFAVEGATLFDAIPEKGKDFVLLNDDGQNYPVTINNATVGYLPSNGMVAQVCFSITAYQNAIIKADVILLNNGGGETTVIAVISATALS